MEFSKVQRQKALNLIGYFLQVFHYLVEITASICLLPIDNAILLASYILGLISARSSIRRRQSVLQDVHFHPKTILITGIDTPHGLSVARCWYYEGHPVVGAEVRDLPIRSGESMSKTLGAFYRIPKSQYVSRLLDIVNREKVDVWIPCSERISVLEDAMAKQVVESRTNCKCMHLDTELANLLGHSDSFDQYLVERELPVVGSHRVQSRDSIHKILHRSPTKIYLMKRATPVPNEKKESIALPKRTSSQTYSEVSEVQISKDRPWILQQQIRLGEFRAEMLVVRGHVTGIKVQAANKEPGWGDSRLDEGLVIAIHKLMESFAMKSGPRLTGHLAVKMMVDEEFESNSVRYVIHISGCTQGAAAVKSLLQDPSCPIVSGYLALLSSHSGGMVGDTGKTPGRVKAIISPTPQTVSKTTMVSEILKYVPLSSSTRELVDALVFETKKFLFWKDWRYSRHDPLPWWWHAHVYRPLSQIGSILTGVGVSNVQ